MNVLVCGLPGSGNRLVKRLIEAAGGRAHVRHGNTGLKYLLKYIDAHAGCRAVIPIRAMRAESRSNRWAKTAQQKDECVKNVILALARRPKVPVRMVSYESLFLHPEESKADLLEWLGLPNVPWPNAPRNENEKWMTTTRRKVIGWRAWMAREKDASDLRVVDSRLTHFGELRDVQVIVLYCEDGTRATLSGRDYYWLKGECQSYVDCFGFGDAPSYGTGCVVAGKEIDETAYDAINAMAAAAKDF